MPYKFNPFTGTLDLIDTTTAGGADTQIQFNDGGVLSGDADLTFDKATDTLDIANLDINNNLTLDSNTFTDVVTGVGDNDTIPTQGYVDDAIAGSIVSPAGADTQVQFNDGGVFGADANLSFDKASSELDVPTLNVNKELNINAPVIAGREILFKCKVNDDADSLFLIANQTSTASKFFPLICGITGDNGTPFSFTGFTLPANDTGTDPLIRFFARATTSLTDPVNGTYSAISTRPVFQFTNHTTNLLTILANGRIGLSNITNPTEMLTLEGNIRQSSVVDGQGIFGWSSNDVNQLFSITSQAGGGAASLSLSAYGGIGLTGGRLKSPATADYHLYVTSAGNVGIRTTSPTEELDVKGNIKASGNITVGKRLLGAKGADVVSANNITLGDGNYFDIRGTTQINTISVKGWTAGSVVILQFDLSLTVKHATAGTGAQLQLASASDFSATAGDTLTLVYDGTYWRETARTAI
jgi:hypothetical protein